MTQLSISMHECKNLFPSALASAIAFPLRQKAPALPILPSQDQFSPSQSDCRMVYPAQQRQAPPNRRGPTPPRPTTLQLCPYMVSARLMALLWPGPDTTTRNYPHLTEEDMPGIQRCFLRTLDYLQQTHPDVLEQIWPPPG